MIIDFNKASISIKQKKNPYFYCLIDVVSLRDNKMNVFFDRVSSSGIDTIGDVLENYTQKEFFDKFSATSYQKKQFLEGLSRLNMQFK